MPRNEVRAAHLLRGEGLDRLPDGLARIECGVVAGLAVPEAVDGEHVVAFCQVGKHARVVLPLHALAVHEVSRAADGALDGEKASNSEVSIQCARAPGILLLA